MKKEIAVGDYVHLETWKPGDKLYSEWIEQYDEYKGVIEHLKPEEEILPAGVYTLKVDYPLNTPMYDTHTFSGPITREEMVKWIVDSYRYIYDMEKKTSSIEEGYVPGTLNRSETDGEFGIWGHVLGDLDLHTIWVDENNIITLGVDS
jgi:hypothetical protein